MNDALLAAHEAGDLPMLIRLYNEAGNRHEAEGDIDAACFYLTHAFVFALQEGAEEAFALSHRLAHYGREEPLIAL